LGVHFRRTRPRIEIAGESDGFGRPGGHRAVGERSQNRLADDGGCADFGAAVDEFAAIELFRHAGLQSIKSIQG